MTLQMPRQTFQRQMSDGTIGTIVRKPFTRRSTRSDAWLYHMRQMAAAEDPLRYIRRFLRIEDELETETTPASVEIQDPRFIIDEEDLLTEE